MHCWGPVFNLFWRPSVLWKLWSLIKTETLSLWTTKLTDALWLLVVWCSIKTLLFATCVFVGFFPPLCIMIYVMRNAVEKRKMWWNEFGWTTCVSATHCHHVHSAAMDLSLQVRRWNIFEGKRWTIFVCVETTKSRRNWVSYRQR